MRCCIGITCSWQEAESRHVLRDDYVKAVSYAGGTPLLIPTLPAEAAGDIYRLCDGLIFSGGDDLDPFFFGEEPQVGLGEINPLRDLFELALAKLALAGTKPVLAICRGLQVVNVAAGGGLYQDLKGFTKAQHNQKAPRWYPAHEVRLDEPSRLFGFLGKKNIRVNSFHHQGINRLGADLTAAGKSRDGLIEALETADPRKWLIGVQWHPECSWEKDADSARIFQFFVDEVKRRKD